MRDELSHLVLNRRDNRYEFSCNGIGTTRPGITLNEFLNSNKSPVIYEKLQKFRLRVRVNDAQISRQTRSQFIELVHEYVRELEFVSLPTGFALRLVRAFEEGQFPHLRRVNDNVLRATPGGKVTALKINEVL